MKRHVALVGFMASGKSTIGRKLARKLGWAFADTDTLVSSTHGPISAIFAEEGEAAFRRYEHAAIGEVLEKEERTVVALGGGALTLPENRRLVSIGAYSIFIKVSAEQVLARVRRSREARPLLGPAPTLATIGELYAKRLPAYESADCTIHASQRTDAQIIIEIVAWLRKTTRDTGRAAS